MPDAAHFAARADVAKAASVRQPVRESGKILFRKGTFAWQKREMIDAGKEIGYTIDMNGDIIPARSLKIHYSKTGTHVAPRSKEWEK